MYKTIYTAVMAVFLWGKSCSVEVEVPAVYVWSEILLHESTRFMRGPSVNGYMISQSDDIDTITWSPELIHRLYYVGTGLIKFDQRIEYELRVKYSKLYKSWNYFVQNIPCNSETYTSATQLLRRCLKVVR